ncbi:hypothetical protein MAQ5080_01096 [Marinomonas aquimarina]|uniref:DUF2339 domain-containing protein n=1 Tax=Marinomonas aquimarina TaxID=295068 RepID=A0A1A8TAD3_9GAMM|nr:DUF2339 domain-containing protein [Marinomonas aquimarina]SBS28443.1 hypothetical protein MAQ5080_01096 [Marinomonas aquimarina]
MGKIIVAIIIGLFVGEIVLSGPFGWLFGGLVGLSLGQVWQLSSRVKGLEREVSRLQTNAYKERMATARPSEEQAVPAADAPGPEAPTEQNTMQPAAPQTEALQEADRWLDKNVGRDSRDENLAPKFQFLNQLSEQVRRFFSQGNPVVRVGMLVLFFGLSFLAKYASSAGLFPIEMRLTVIALIATALLIIGWLTRHRQHGYGLILQGGGIAALYLTIFAAGKFYDLMPITMTFALMTVIVVFGVTLAVMQSAQGLALMATIGGFLAPILTSDGAGNHVALFGFYLWLSLGILAIAWFKSWRLLNWVGFFFTFAITSVWAVLRYEAQLYNTTQPFLIAFFVLYLLVSVLFSIKQPPKLTGLVDGSLVFGLPVVAFGLQTLLLKDSEYGLPISAVTLAALYLALAALLLKKYQQTQRLLRESFIALGIIFLTLAVPLALDASWTSATWCIEAAGLVWIGARQQRWLARAAGYLLYIAGVVSLQVANNFYFSSLQVAADNVMSLLILAFSIFSIGLILQRHRGVLKRYEMKLEGVSILVGLVWWYAAGSIKLFKEMSPEHVFAGMITFVSLSALAFMMFSRRLHWPHLLNSAYSLLPLVALWCGVYTVFSLYGGDLLRPYEGLGGLAFALFAGAQYGFLWLKGKQLAANPEPSKESLVVKSWHVFTVWALLASLIWEVSWYQYMMLWNQVTSLLIWFATFTGPMLILMWLLNRPFWPITQYRGVYKDVVPIPMVLLLLLWFYSASFHSGATPWFHVPILNPMDLAQLALVILMAYTCRQSIMATKRVRQGLTIVVPAVLGFVWLNIVLLRGLHHFIEVPYNSYALWHSSTVQMSLSILWSLCALVIMNVSRRQQSRKIWLLGVSVLGVVLLKLFTIDLQETGNLTRIVSFMAVGGLMLLIGYLSPIPNRADEAKSDQEEPAP